MAAPTLWRAAMSRQPSSSMLGLARRCAACECPASYPATLRIPRARQPAIARLLQTAAAAARARTTTAPPAPQTSAPAPTGVPATAKPPRASHAKPASYAGQLASKNGPTVLYEAPSHTVFRFSSYSTGLFCAMYSGYHYVDVLMAGPNPGLAWWVPHAYSVLIAFMGVVSVYFFRGAWGLVRVIRAVPRPPAPSPSNPLASATSSAAASRQLPILLEIETSPLLPFMRSKVLRVEPSEVAIPARYVMLRQMGEYMDNPETSVWQPDPRQRLAAQKAARAQAMAEAQYDKENLLTSPFRHMGKAFKTFFVAVKRSLTRAGFVKIEISGEIYRIDIHNAWALEDGRSLDRLLTVKPLAKSPWVRWLTK